MESHFYFFFFYLQIIFNNYLEDINKFDPNPICFKNNNSVSCQNSLNNDFQTKPS